MEGRKKLQGKNIMPPPLLHRAAIIKHLYSAVGFGHFLQSSAIISSYTDSY